MRIATISSKKLADAGEGTVKNNYLYNDKELFDDGDLNWYDYGFRNYDPQIGRFTQLDPLAFEFSFLTPYQYASNDPIGNIDMDGLEGADISHIASSVSGGAHIAADALDIPTGALAIEKTLGNVIVTAAKPVVKIAVHHGFFWGVGRFLKGAGESILETAKFALNTLNPDPDKNSLVKTGKFLYNTVTYPVGTFNNIKTAIKNTDWNDPEVYGKIFGTVALPVASVKIVKYFSEASEAIDVTESMESLEGTEGTGTTGIINNAEKGWKVGEPITNLTAKGNVPAWGTVRQRFWKNEAFLNGGEYSESNLLRMQKGLAPQRLNPNTGLMESMELHHHIVPQRNGGLFDFIKVWPDEHRALDPFRQ